MDMWAVSLPHARPGSTESKSPFKPAAACKDFLSMAQLVMRHAAWPLTRNGVKHRGVRYF